MGLGANLFEAFVFEAKCFPGPRVDTCWVVVFAECSLISLRFDDGAGVVIFVSRTRDRPDEE